jgi:transcriptional regulator with XRE-family HTH domain
MPLLCYIMHMRQVHEIIKEQRQLFDWSLRKLAEEAGVSFSYIRNLEAGTSIPTLPVLLKILHALEINPHEFIDEFFIYHTENKHPEIDVLMCCAYKVYMKTNLLAQNANNNWVDRFDTDLDKVKTAINELMHALNEVQTKPESTTTL